MELFDRFEVAAAVLRKANLGSEAALAKPDIVAKTKKGAHRDALRHIENRSLREYTPRRTRRAP